MKRDERLLLCTLSLLSHLYHKQTLRSLLSPFSLSYTHTLFSLAQHETNTKTAWTEPAAGQAPAVFKRERKAET